MQQDLTAVADARCWPPTLANALTPTLPSMPPQRLQTVMVPQSTIGRNLEFQ